MDKEEKKAAKAARRHEKAKHKEAKKVLKRARRLEKAKRKAEKNRRDAQGLKKTLKRFRAQFGLQSVVIVLAAAAALMLMTWLIRDVLDVRHIYAAAGFEIIGIVVVLVAFLIPFNIVLYRRRVREVVTLSDAIRQVAGGDFKSRIPTDKRSQITPIYEDFNKMCDELESVRILRNDFINNYSHEFKTPIASIKGFAELLIEKPDLSDDDRRRYLNIIADESARLSKFASDTTLLSRLSAQQIVTDQEVYDISEQLRQCSIILSYKWLEKKQDFVADLVPASFNGNKELAQHLWINLMDNAIKYTQEGGSITVRNRIEGPHIIVEIEDNGEGIGEEALRNLFAPYFQEDASHSRQGLGLGLSIAKRVADLCRGDISVESQIGRGSKFTVRLPAYRTNQQ